ncbi:MAG TPA: hypothetical protein VF092_25515 [Longimicrobium sp.]
MSWNPFRSLKLFGGQDIPADPHPGGPPPAPVAAAGGTPLPAPPWYPPELRIPGVPAALGAPAPSGDEDALAHVRDPRSFTRVAWEAVADPGPQPHDEGDDDGLDAYARRLAVARFARRVLEPDPHAWIEALYSYRERIRLPVDPAFTVAVEADLALRLSVELPPPSIVAPGPREAAAQTRARYDELCCGIVLAFACDTFRLLPPAADSVYVTGYRVETNPATGHPHYAVMLRLATDRDSLEAIDLARAKPSAALEHLGGAANRQRGELVPLAFEEDLQRLM